ncbi:MAG: acyl-CoA/acyl-ACP dehydrogenase [Candidatus Brevundimonas phytovorans]|nr:acyl-CoA dehydrogenase family protein [Brevundimonas sp.]WEK56746.1 MAG: acyl-CoA/acyl-ACP dehydrogenase [Brevundimonas sp.]
MDFQLTADQTALRDAARAFARGEMASVGLEVERTNEPLSKDWKKKLGEMGFMGINISQEYGGLGLGALEALLVLEEFGKIHTGMAFPIFESSVGPVKVIEHMGSEVLKQRILPAVCRGEHVVAIAMSEPDAGTALTDLTARGEIKGDKIVLNGLKRWSSGGGRSDGYLVYCKLSDAPGAKGIGAVYVDHDTPGLSFGSREMLMGFRGVYSADIILDNVEVPLENLVAPAGGFPDLMGAFCLERCGNATMSLAIAAAAYEDILDYVQERHAFSKPLVDFQAVQMKIAEIAMQVEASRLLIHRAVAGVGQGFPSVVDSSMAKCFANEMVRDVTSKAMQLMGGYGYSKEYPAEQRFRDAWGWGIAGGSIDIQKINIASALVGRRFNQRAK